MSSPRIDVVIPVYGGWDAHPQLSRAPPAADRPAHRRAGRQRLARRHARPRRGGVPAGRGRRDGRQRRLLRAPSTPGVAHGSGEIVVALNNDVDGEPELLERLAAAFQDPRVGSAAPLLLRPGATRLDAYGIAVDPTLSGFVRLAGAPVAAAEAPPASLPLLGPYGAAAAYRRSVYEAAGGLDERIFMYGEELDLALRMAAAGWRCAAVPRRAASTSAARRPARRRRRRSAAAAAFARGYLMRRYGVLRAASAQSAPLLTEAIVIAGDLVLSRDLEALRGRVEGWRAGAGRPRHAPPEGALIAPLSFRDSLRLRVADRQ